MFQRYDGFGNPDGSYKAVYFDGFSQVIVAPNEADKASELAAALSAYDALYASKPKRKRAVLLIANARGFYNVNDTLSQGFATGGGTIADYRALLLSVYNLIMTGSGFPPSITGEFTAETAGLATIANNATWTMVDCNAWHVRIGQWVGRAMGGAALARSAVQELD